MTDLQRPDVLIDWLQSCLDRHPSGVFWLQMPAGSGKTTFGLSLNLPNVTTRCLSLESSFQTRGHIFATRLMELHSQDERGEPLFVDRGILAPRLHLDISDSILFWDLVSFHPAHRNRFERYYGTKRSLMVLDGLEWFDQGDSDVLSFLTPSSLLRPDCYVLLLTRPEADLSSNVVEVLQQLKPLETRRFDSSDLSLRDAAPWTSGSARATRLLTILAWAPEGLTLSQLAFLAQEPQLETMPSPLAPFLSRLLEVREGGNSRYHLPAEARAALKIAEEGSQLVQTLARTWITNLPALSAGSPHPPALRAVVLVWLLEVSKGGLAEASQDLFAACQSTAQALIEVQDRFSPNAWPLRFVEALLEPILATYRAQAPGHNAEAFAPVLGLWGRLFELYEHRTIAEAAYEEALNLLRGLPGETLIRPVLLAEAWLDWGRICRSNRENDQAREAFTQAIAVWEALARPNPVHELALARAWAVKADFEAWVYQYRQADEDYQTALDLLRPLVASGQPRARIALISVLLDRASSLSHDKRPDQAIGFIDQALAHLEVGFQDPSLSDLLVRALRVRAYVHQEGCHDGPAALADYKRLQEVLEAGVPADRTSRLILFRGQGEALMSLGRADEAVTSFSQALDLLLPLDQARRLYDRRDLAELYRLRGQAHRLVGAPDRAYDDLHEAHQRYHGCHDGGFFVEKADLAGVDAERAEVLYALGREEEALDQLDRVLFDFEMYDSDGELKTGRPVWARVHTLRGQIRLSKGDEDGAWSDFVDANSVYGACDQNQEVYDPACQAQNELLLDQTRAKIKARPPVRRKKKA